MYVKISVKGERVVAVANVLPPITRHFRLTCLNVGAS